MRECIEAKKMHAAKDSAVNTLAHGLDRYFDHGKYGYKHYVTLAVGNVQLSSLLKFQKTAYSTDGEAYLKSANLRFSWSNK